MNGQWGTLVVGGSGLIGRAIQRVSARDGDQDSFGFTFSKNRVRIQNEARAVSLDLLSDVPDHLLDEYSSAIYVAGSTDHGLAKSNPREDLRRNTVAFLNFMEHFKGNLVLLSSQAVYYGLSGRVVENTRHIAEMPYGLSKQMAEEYAKYFLRIGRLSNLWIVRLMYSFGNGERASRIIPSCASAAKSGGRLDLRGGGASFLNPLPALFVAEVLLQATKSQQASSGELIVTNLNYAAPVRVVDIVEFLSGISHFEYSVKDDGEDWPVKFWGDVDAISRWLEKWDLVWPDIWKEIEIYFNQLMDNEAGL